MTVDIRFLHVLSKIYHRKTIFPYTIPLLAASATLACLETIPIFLLDSINLSNVSSINLRISFLFAISYLAAPCARILYTFILSQLTPSLAYDFYYSKLDSLLAKDVEQINNTAPEAIATEFTMHYKTFIVGTLNPVLRSLYYINAFFYILLSLILTVGFSLLATLVVPVSLYLLFLVLQRRSINSNGKHLFDVEQQLSAQLLQILTNLPRLIQSGTWPRHQSSISSMYQLMLNKLSNIIFFQSLSSLTNEVVLFSATACIITYMYLSGHDFSTIIAILTSAVIGFQRLIPCISIIGSANSSMSAFKNQADIFLDA
jgi:hypothetical protein